MSRDYNSFTRKTIASGGGIPIWAENPKMAKMGGKLANTLAAGEILPAGSPVYLDVETATAKILKSYQIKAVDEGGSVGTETYLITLYDLPLLPKPKVGEFVMVMPSTLAGTGKSVAIAALDTSVAGELTFEVLQANFDTPVEGGFIVQSSATTAGSSKTIYCTPNSLTINDTIGGDVNLVGVARGEKYIYKNTMPPAPDVVLANIPMLEFAWFGELQNSGYIV